MTQTKNAAPAALPTAAQVNAERQRLKYRAAYRRALRNTVNVLVLVAAVAVLVSSLVLPVMQISGNSMEPELTDGDIVVLVKARTFDPGDVVAFTWNNKTLVKRVIACAGDWVTLDAAGTVFVNGEALAEPYVRDAGAGETDVAYPYQVPDGSYWVMGDRRATSVDSRSTLIGCVPAEHIVGKVFFKIPWKR